jgi:hypothetical protein
VWNRRKVWPVRFDQQPVKWRFADGLVVSPILESHHSAERHIVAVNQPRSQEAHTAAEGVQDNSNVGVVVQDGHNIIVRFTGVNDGGLTTFAGNGELGFKRETLVGSRRVIVVVIESGLPDCNDSRITQDAAQPTLRFLVPIASFVRVQPGGGNQTRLPLAELERSLSRGAGLPDYHHPGHAASPGAFQDSGSISLVRLVGEMTMCVDQQRRQTIYLPRCPLALPSAAPAGPLLEVTACGFRPAAGTAGAFLLAARCPRAAGPGQRFSMAIRRGDAM